MIVIVQDLLVDFQNPKSTSVSGTKVAGLSNICFLSYFKRIISNKSFFQKVGCAYSGYEIAANLVGHAEKVTNLFRRPYLICPKLLKIKKENAPNIYSILPWDIYFFRRSLNSQIKEISSTQKRQLDIEKYSELFPIQTNKLLSHPALFFDLNDPQQPILVSISNQYGSYVNEKKIIPIRSTIKRFEANGVYLEDDTFHEVDAVIYCTGYEKSLTVFLDDFFLKAIKYSEALSKQTFSLYKCTFQPDIQNMAFVGLTKGLFFPGI